MRFLRVGNEMWDMSKIPPGLGLYTLRNETKKDFFGTLKKVADMGYKLVEFALDYEGIPAAEMKKELERLGLKTVSTYVSPEDMENNLQNQIDYAKTLGAHYMVTGFPKERFADESDFPALVHSLKTMGKEVKRHGMLLLYHPHAHEFEKRNGKKIIDRLLEGVGRDLMQLELDLYFVRKVGLDPKSALLAYSGMSPLIHVKDIDKNGDFTEVGYGIIDWPSIFRIMESVGVKFYFVEQDVSPHPLESAKKSLDYLKSIQ
ncbi:sugar phosphate isomerase/epimerase [Paenibacillus sp. LHD-38]|uniref:sugar phosphate isomerase/epimerase family protein n=1 Tax=Paenibacillus sp. LHD-38 TaxID=3072143 RepID=UPI00280FE6CF|nr:sugar phosphate isomerase/epimerase [Paenibacillus sp. LHD-38]MDQ8733524.1 sugar phosphate isomerase/epimerase [Paenibacillus sp. LHD-38]